MRELPAFDTHIVVSLSVYMILIADTSGLYDTNCNAISYFHVIRLVIGVPVYTL